MNQVWARGREEGGGHKNLPTYLLTPVLFTTFGQPLHLEITFAPSLHLVRKGGLNTCLHTCPCIKIGQPVHLARKCGPTNVSACPDTTYLVVQITYPAYNCGSLNPTALNSFPCFRPKGPYIRDRTKGIFNECMFLTTLPFGKDL